MSWRIVQLIFYEKIPKSVYFQYIFTFMIELRYEKNDFVLFVSYKIQKETVLCKVDKTYKR